MMSSPYRFLNFFELCRICCNCNSGDQKVNIFSEDGRNYNLTTKMLECLSLDVSEKDRLPKVVCMQCVHQLENISEYRKLCKNSQDMLMNMISGGNKANHSVQHNANASGHNLMNTIMHSVNLQQQSGLAGGAEKSLMQYTVTVDAVGNIKTEPIHAIPNTPQLSQQVLPAPPAKSEKQIRHSNLEELIKMKPNLKVTPISKKDKNTIKQNQLQQEAPVQEQNDQQLEQKEITQLQLQQLQQQLQQLQHQQQMNQLTQFGQLQTQQMTIATASNTQTNDLLSPGKSKKPKLNFVLTTPGAQTITTALPQLATQPTQIQLQIQPTHTMTAAQHQQAQSNVTTASLLSNLAPLLQAQPSANSTTASTMLSPSKCYLPITIKDENSDQQIVAHIDTKSLLLPTTYQLQMKLQPQITTVDGQTVVQLTPTATAIPTFQLQPQTIAAQETFQAQPPQSLLNSNGTDCNSIFQQPQPQALHLQHQQTAQQNIQIMSQQIIRPATVNAPTLDVADNSAHTNDAATSTHEEENITSNMKVIKHAETDIRLQIKYKPTKSQESSAFEITPTTNLTQQIMQQVQQQQKLKIQQKQTQTQKQQQQQQTKQQQTFTTATTLRTVPTQHGGITVQRITTTKAANSNTNNNKPLQQTLASPPKLPMLNKQNVTISRIVPQQQQHQTQKIQPPESAIAKITQKLKVQLPYIKQELNQEEAVDEKSHLTEKRNLRKQSKANYPIAPTNVLSSQPVNVQQQQSLSAPINSVQPTTSTESTPRFASVQGSNTTGNSFECKECGRAFKKKEHLTQHAKLHIGLRPFKCTEPQCLKTFNRKEHLLRHQISHTGEKLFRCDVCQKPFSRKDNLNKHRRIHQPNANNYSCEVCGKSFAVKAYYEQHLSIHSDNRSKQDDSVVMEENADHLQQQTNIQILTQQINASNNQHEQQIVHLQLPVVTTTQDYVGSTITFTSHSNNVNDSQQPASSVTSSLTNFLPHRPT